jgi:hypothetical protein
VPARNTAAPSANTRTVAVTLMGILRCG